MPDSLAKHSLEELAEIQDGIDRNAHPIRYQEVCELIEKKLAEQQADEPIVKEHGAITNKLLISTFAFSCLVVIKPWYAIQTGVISVRHRHQYAVADEPIMFWMVTGMWLMVAALPFVLLVQRLISDRRNKADKHKRDTTK